MAYRVILEGTTAAGFDPAEVKRLFARMTGQQLASVQQLFSGTPRVIKSGATQEYAERIVAGLRAIGAPARSEAQQPELSSTQALRAQEGMPRETAAAGSGV